MDDLTAEMELIARMAEIDLEDDDGGDSWGDGSL